MIVVIELLMYILVRHASERSVVVDKDISVAKALFGRFLVVRAQDGNVTFIIAHGRSNPLLLGVRLHKEGFL